jgi:hypothetical protein
VVLLAACGSTGTAPSPGTPANLGGGSAAGAADTVDCDGKPCAAPASCIDVVGSTPQSGRKECWITCSDKPCPNGLRCEMIHDGPGQVCENETPSRAP